MGDRREQGSWEAEEQTRIFVSCWRVPGETGAVVVFREPGAQIRRELGFLSSCAHRKPCLAEAQLKEVKEMLEQEGLSEIAHSNASEQIAYLLVERTTLLEKLEITDQKLNSHSYVDRLCAAQLQVHPALAAQTV